VAVSAIAKCQIIEKSHAITKIGFDSEDNKRQIQKLRITYPGNTTMVAIGDTKKDIRRAAQKIPAMESDPAISLGIDR
jgi:hypothetical protein